MSLNNIFGNGFQLREKYIQKTDNNCGLECLALYAELENIPSMLYPELVKNYVVGPDGLTASELIKIAEDHGVVIIPKKVSLSNLTHFEQCAILHVNGDHFVLFMGMESDKLLIFDNKRGLFCADKKWFSDNYKWDGIALVLGQTSTSISLRLLKYVSSFSLTIALSLVLLFIVFKDSVSKQHQNEPQFPRP